MKTKGALRKAYQQAFTLIEMLVVMIIVGLIVTLIVQGFGYSMGLYQRVVATQRQAYSEAFAYEWLRTSIAPAVAARPNDRGLEGDAEQLSTYSYQPLIAAAGLKTLIKWQLQLAGRELTLSYEEDAQKFVVYRWPGAMGQFEYLDDKGRWNRYWPAQKSDAPSLPEVVRLVVNSGQEQRNYVVQIPTRKRPEVTMDELMYGR